VPTIKKKEGEGGKEEKKRGKGGGAMVGTWSSMVPLP